MAWRSKLLKSVERAAHDFFVFISSDWMRLVAQPSTWGRACEDGGATA